MHRAMSSVMMCALVIWLVNMQRITMSAISRALLNTLAKIQKVTKSEGMRAQVIIPASMRNKTSLVLNRVLVVTMHALT